MSVIITKDFRLKSYHPVGTLLVGKNTSLNQAVNLINEEIHRLGYVNRLAIFCHGGLAGWQYSHEGVNIGNVNKFDIIKGKVGRIIVYACLAAHRQNWNLCMRLANITNATVVASTSTQLYYPENMSFGHWEGSLFEFPPLSSPGRLQQGRRGDSRRIQEAIQRRQCQ